MTRTRRVVLAVLCCAILLSSLCSVQATYNQKVGGSYSSVTALTPRCRAWFAETFGQCESLVGLLVCVNLFACRNFRYTPQEDFLVQNFDCHKFLFDKPFEGVCFEFACFVKCAVLVPCSHSRAIPSFPSQLDWKIVLAWANTRGSLNSPS